MKQTKPGAMNYTSSMDKHQITRLVACAIAKNTTNSKTYHIQVLLYSFFPGKNFLLKHTTANLMAE